MESIAIIGTGIAGMGAAHFLHKDYDIRLFEQNNYVGGHTNTVTVNEGATTRAVDTGFIVFNNQTYPNLIRLFGELGVKTKPTNMSFSVQDIENDLVYSSLNLFIQRKNIVRPTFLKLLTQINRFYRQAEETLQDEKYAYYSLLDYAKERGYGSEFIYSYLVPMSSALWSTPIDVTLRYPVSALVQFFKNHGLLGINTQFQWYTVDGGSWQYRDKLIAPFRDKIEVNKKVLKVVREDGKAKLVLNDGDVLVFDKVVMAAHADQSLSMLDASTPLERSLLSNFRYQKNLATLHSDERVMPRYQKAWSAWNYRVQQVDGELTATTIYDMNILQSVSDKVNYFVSINDPGLVRKEFIHRQITYEHPIFTPDTAKAQLRLQELNQHGPAYFCGSYFRFGFHEDALTASLEACRSILGRDPWTRSAGIVKSEREAVLVN